MAFSNKKQLNHLYEKQNEGFSSNEGTSKVIDIGYILHDCEGELKINNNHNIGFLNTSVDEVRLNKSLQRIKLIQTEEEKVNDTSSI